MMSEAVNGGHGRAGPSPDGGDGNRAGLEDDRTRFAELFRRHYGAVMRYAARRVGRERAPDIVSEAFLGRLGGLDATAAATVMGCSRTAYKVRLFRSSRRPVPLHAPLSGTLGSARYTGPSPHPMRIVWPQPAK